MSPDTQSAQSQKPESLWRDLKAAVSERRWTWASLVLALVGSAAALDWIAGRIETKGWFILVCAIVSLLGLALTYLSDRRRARREDIAKLPAGALLAGSGLALLASWAVVAGVDPLLPWVAALLVLLSVALVLPALLDGLAWLLSHVPLIKRLPPAMRSSQTIYLLLALGQTALAIWIVYDRPREWWALAFLLSCLLGAYLRRTLWNRRHALWFRWLPHVGMIGIPVAIAVDVVGARGSDTCFGWLLLLAVAGTVYWIALRLQRRVVEPLAGEQIHAHDSIQSNDLAYRDVHKSGQRLIDTIKHSDAGVFGLTGVRGAGKSSLARYVLYKLGRQFFTLEITSPARHDPDLGFFLSVCRAVAQRVRDDLRPSFDPESSVQSVLARALRNTAFLLLGPVAALTLLLAQPQGPASSKSTVFGRKLDESSSAQAWETAIVRRLLAEMDIARQKPCEAGWGHLIVPVQDRSLPYFQVLPVRVEGDHRHLVAEHLRVPQPPRLSQASWWYGRSSEGDVTWLLGITRHYAEQITGRVLAADSRCPRDAPVAHVLRCAAVEAAGGSEYSFTGFLIGSVFPTGTGSSPAPATPNQNDGTKTEGMPGPPSLRLVMDDSQLSELATLLGYYADSLEPSSKSVTTMPAKVGWVALPRPGWDTGGVFWTSFALLVLIAGIALLWAPVGRLLRAIVNRRDLMLYRDAEAFLQELSYSSSREATQGLSLYGLSLGGKRTMADRALTLPALTARYQWFVRRIREHYNGKVVIAIDELDKIHDPAQVQGLLSEIKGALFVEGTFYLVSISEDAASSFRKRLSSGRDIFESTFDEIVEIPQMTLQHAETMLRARIDLGGESQPALGCDILKVGTLLAGGIPREVLRNFRALAKEQPADRNAACCMLVSRELTEWIADLANSKLSGAEVVEVRRLAIEARVCVCAGGLQPAFAALDKCLNIIDPRSLRVHARSPELLDGGGEEQHRANAYLALSHDIQSCLRLQLLVTIGQLVAGGRAIDAFAPRVFDAYAVLQRKPALAETLLSQIRADMQAGDLPKAASPAAQSPAPPQA